MISRDEIVQQALALNPEDRAYIADVLEHSLSDETFATPEFAAAWVAEIERRIAAYDRGEMQAARLDIAFDRMRRQLADHRARKATS
jgi:hypothetical protein